MRRFYVTGHAVGDLALRGLLLLDLLLHSTRLHQKVRLFLLHVLQRLLLMLSARAARRRPLRLVVTLEESFLRMAGQDGLAAHRSERFLHGYLITEELEKG